MVWGAVGTKRLTIHHHADDNFSSCKWWFFTMWMIINDHANDEFLPCRWWFFTMWWIITWVKIIIRIVKNHHPHGHFLLCHYSSQDHVDHFQIWSDFKTSDDLQKILTYFRNLRNIPIFRVIRKTNFFAFITFLRFHHIYLMNQ